MGDDAVPEREALPGLFGLVSHWSPDTTITRHTYNARSESVAEKPSFRDAWKHAKHCIIPAEAFYEPDWRTGKPIPTRIARADGDPMSIAGLWSVWKSPKGEDVHSYTDVDDQCRHASVDESLSQSNGRKKMIVILPPDRYQDWLTAPAEISMEFMMPVGAEVLQAVAG